MARGRKAYDPTQTVAGKTGTCIGDGGWVGLFTSYAPLANPRLAVVVIAQGTDARRHFPAAVAGEIYRGLNHRFGTAINLQVATTLDDEEKKSRTPKKAAEQTADSIAGETPETSSATPTVTPSPATAPKTTEVKPATPEQRNPVKRVLMPLEKKPEAQKTTQPTTPGSEQRPRRIPALTLSRRSFSKAPYSILLARDLGRRKFLQYFSQYARTLDNAGELQEYCGDFYPCLKQRLHPAGCNNQATGFSTARILNCLAMFEELEPSARLLKDFWRFRQLMKKITMFLTIGATVAMLALPVAARLLRRLLHRPLRAQLRIAAGTARAVQNIH